MSKAGTEEWAKRVGCTLAAALELAEAVGWFAVEVKAEEYRSAVALEPAEAVAVCRLAAGAVVVCTASERPYILVEPTGAVRKTKRFAVASLSPLI